ncbi:MAG TPA: YciI family protein [Verrucomicrobiae bacterium]|nr:YciI family protein [Verrucomicrobiae bacterium]
MKEDTTAPTAEPKQFILLFRGKDWDEGVPPEQLQALMDRYMDWAQGLFNSGKVRGGQALGRTGVTITRRGVADGPFAETKEAIGGYSILAVDTLEEAVEFAKTAPFLDFEGSIEVREMLEECPVFKRIRERHGLVPKPLKFAAAA